MADGQQLPALKTPDKVVGGVIAGGIVVGILYVLYQILPFLIELAKNTMILGVELAALCVLAMILLDKNTWGLVYYKWKSISRSLRKMIVRDDPIGVLDTAIHRFEAKLDDIDENIKKSTAAKQRLANKIRSRDHSGALDQAQYETDLAKAAQQTGKPKATVEQHAVAAVRWQKVAESLQPFVDTLARAQVQLERARDLCAGQLEDLKNRKATLAVQLEGLQEGQKSVRSFKRFFGHSQDNDMKELAIEEIERQSTEAEAEIDQFMRVITPTLDNADLAKQAEAIQAMDTFQKYLDGGKAPVAALPPGVKDGEIVVSDAPKVNIKR